MSGRHFRKPRIGQPLTRDEGLRQGRAVKAASAALGDVDAIRNFLNSHHPVLRGRPLDLAVASDAGLEAVENAICAQVQAASQSC